MTTASKPGNPNFDAGNLLALATLFVGLVTAWLYLAGRTYAYHYYGAYGLGLLGLGIDSQDYLLFGAWVIDAHPISVAVWTIVTFLFAWAVLRSAGAGWMLGWLVVAIGIAFQLAFVAAPIMARTDAADDRSGDYRAQPLVVVSVDTAWSTEPSDRDRAAALGSGCYRLLVAGDKGLVLLRPFRDAPQAELATTLLRWEAVRLLRILPPGRSCP